MAYTKLANSILTSTIWMENDQTRIVWMTLLAMADQHGEVQASVPGLANVARVSVEACEAAILTFMSPDHYSRTKSSEGRRIEEMDGGWHILNHEKYRELASDLDRKRKAADRQKRRRDRLKAGHVVTLPGVTDCDKSHQIPQAEANTEAEAEADTKKERESARPRFLPPSVDEVKAYAADAKLTNMDSEAFHDHYTANGWKQGGGKPIKDWKAACRQWNRRQLDFGQPKLPEHVTTYKRI